MKQFLLIAGIVCFTLPMLHCQVELQWAFSTGGNGDSVDGTRQVVSDEEGNLYIAGYFDETTDFDPGPGEFNLTCLATTTGNNAFIAKYAADGSFIWADALTSSLGSGVYCLALDSEQQLLVAGYYTSNIDVDPGPTEYTFNAVGWQDTFVARYSSTDGSLIWAFTYGNNLYDYPYTLVPDGLGSFIVMGQYALTIDFDGSEEIFEYTSEGDVANIYIARYDEDGNFEWVKNITSAHPGNETFGWPRAVVYDSSGNIIIASSFYETADFDPSANAFEITGVGYTYEAFIAKYSADGEFIFAKAIIGDDDTNCHALTTDDSGNIYIAGYNSGQTDFDPGPATANHTSETQDAFFAKYDATGNMLWTKHLTSTDGSMTFPRVITLDESGNIYLACAYRFELIDVDPGPGQLILDGDGAHNMLIAVYDNNGNFLDVSDIRSGTFDSHSMISDMIIEGDELVITGYFNDTLDFNCEADAEHYLVSPNMYDLFVAKYNLPPLSTDNNDELPGTCFVTPNPSSEKIMLACAKIGAPYSIHTVYGRCISSGLIESQINIDDLPAGAYILSTGNNAYRFITN